MQPATVFAARTVVILDLHTAAPVGSEPLLCGSHKLGGNALRVPWVHGMASAHSHGGSHARGMYRALIADGHRQKTPLATLRTVPTWGRGSAADKAIATVSEVQHSVGIGAVTSS
jgi:hypothetical protein